VGKSLIRTDGQAELEDLQRVRFERAVRNLVTGVTPPTDFPGDIIPKRPIRGGAQVQYVPGWWVIEQLNALFGYFWDFEVSDQSIGKDQVWVKGKLTVKGSDGMVISKTQFGGSDIKKMRSTGAIMDIGDDLKSAATDSLKKCATLLGIAKDIYGKRESNEVGAASTQQLDSLYKVGESLGWDREKVVDYAVKEHGKRPEELEILAVLGLINQLREKKKKGSEE